MSTNPFEDRRRSARGGAAAAGSAAASSRNKNRQSDDAEPAIWAARHVEWPIPSALSLPNFTKLVRASKQAASTIGISDGYNDTHKTKTASGEANHTSTNNTHEEEKNAEASSSSYFGLLSRVLTSQPTEDDVPQDHPTDPSASRPLRPPRTKCVATANSWMVAALECPGETSTSTSLRLVSRWNVRRMSGVDHWMALPPPVGSTENARVMHVFCDPTGCHLLVSARNGEAYYHHSSLRVMTKLAGFGRNPDGTLPPLSGIAATTAGPGQVAQLGVSTGSYVTAIAWDRERGTEGSTKKILLGTNTGEIYEYSLASPNSIPDESGDDAASSSNTTLSSPPMLLHQLNSDGAVTGLAFERLRTGLFVMCCTSGKHKRTRFYTFYSAHSSNFKMVLADEAHASLVELPGSVDYADLRLCNDHVCMRTATGIYYGTIDRAQSGPAFAGGSMIMDSGILPYDTDGEKGSNNIPVSLALTPHHIITLSDTNDIRFFNRVAQKVIQKERVDWVGQQSSSQNNSSSLDESHMGVGELLMDVRRPDQVWLRKGRSLVHISPSQEDRDVWKFTLFKSLELAPTINMMRSSSSALQNKSGGKLLTEEEKAQEALFEQAKSLCTNPSQKAVVTAVRAEHHLSQGRAELAAKYLAQCPAVLEPFADTAIRLALPMLQIDDPQSYGGSAQARASLKSSNLPLITYLSDKMRVGKNNNDKMTCTMIGAWLTELYLHERDSSSFNKQALSQFLTTHVHNMDAKTIMQILSSHDVSAGECAAYAASGGDISTAVNAALRVGSDTHDGVVDALKILNEAPFELAEPLYYKYASTLLSRAPILAGKSFLSRFTHGLSPTRLLPSIMHYERLCGERHKARKVAQAVTQGHNPFSDSTTNSGIEESKSMNDIQFDGNNLEVQILPGVSQVGSFVYDSSVSTKYLEGVIKLGCRSSAIYSFLISLYVKLEDEEPLFKFLSAHVPAAAVASDASKRAGLYDGDDGLSGPLDMSYALRTILGTGRHFRSAIKLYMGFGMRQQAVELALKVDPSLARELAQDSVELEERKRLWLMIAKNAASESRIIGQVDVVSKVVSVLKDCGPDVMSIEDVLPFL
jgi:hypothetical protein